MHCILVGAAGRMGKAIVQCLETSALKLSAAITHAGDEALGKDIGLVAGIGPQHLFLKDTLSQEDLKMADVVIDFSPAHQIVARLNDYKKAQCPLVSGTTGWSDDEWAVFKEASSVLPIVWAANWSLGVHTLSQLLKQATAHLGASADIEIVEMHHRNKRDAPSGTALRLGEVIAEERNQSLEACGVFGRSGRMAPQQKGDIGFSALRGGDVYGEHTVIFAMDGERIELTHRASSRHSFAQGAIDAAVWACQQAPGWYSVEDVFAV